MNSAPQVGQRRHCTVGITTDPSALFFSSFFLKNSYSEINEYFSVRFLNTINTQKSEEKKEKYSEEEEKPKEVVVKGLPSGVVIVNSEDRFGS